MSDAASFQWYDIESDPLGWNAQVTATRQNLFHREAMLEAHRYGNTFRRGVLVKVGGQSVGVVGGLLRPGPGGGRFETLSFFPPRDELCSKLPRLLGDWLLGQGVTVIVIGSFDGGVEGYGDQAVGKVAQRLEFLYDLKRGEDERLALANTNHRRKLKKSEREPMYLRRIERGQAWRMTRLNWAWARRRRERYGVRRLVQTYEFYRRLTALLRCDESAGLYGLYDIRNRILSMAYMLERGSSAFYMIGASSREGYERGAAVRLFWELARYYPRIGVYTMNFGGVPVEAQDESHDEHGVYRFKRGFGIEPILRRSLTIEA